MLSRRAACGGLDRAWGGGAGADWRSARLPCAVAQLCGAGRYGEAGGLAMRALGLHPALLSYGSGLALLPPFLQVPSFPSTLAIEFFLVLCAGRGRLGSRG